MPSPSPLQLYIGDTWTILVPVVDGSGNPVDLTSLGLTPGAEFFQANISSPTDLTIANGGVAVVSASSFTLSVGAVLTNAAVPFPAKSLNLPTRLQVFVTDGLNRRTTLGVIPIIPLKP